MSRKLRPFSTCAFVLAVSMTSSALYGQVATGPWTQYSPSYSIQERGCGNVEGSYFYITCSDAGGDQRAERRYVTYSTGSRQFEGYVRIVSLGDRKSVV